MTETGLSGETGPPVLAAVEQQRGPGSGHVTTLPLVMVDSSVLAHFIWTSPALEHRMEEKTVLEIRLIKVTVTVQLNVLVRQVRQSKGYDDESETGPWSFSHCL